MMSVGCWWTVEGYGIPWGSSHDDDFLAYEFVSWVWHDWNCSYFFYRWLPIVLQITESTCITCISSKLPALWSQPGRTSHQRRGRWMLRFGWSIACDIKHGVVIDWERIWWKIIGHCYLEGNVFDSMDWGNRFDLTKNRLSCDQDVINSQFESIHWSYSYSHWEPRLLKWLPASCQIFVIRSTSWHVSLKTCGVALEFALSF